MEIKNIILSEKSWHQGLCESLSEKTPNCNWIAIKKKEDFNLENLKKISPEKIFIPHWSYIIPGSIYEEFECIVFHMTDLPYGRGGSPLQNLIVRGFNKTKISALKVVQGIDAGPVYLKKDMDLYGTAKEIFLRSRGIIEEMIYEIVANKLQPVKQEGRVKKFERRKPEDGELSHILELQKMYDYIRMLDCEGYPSSFIENEHFRFEFSRASLKSEKEILADVRIIKK